MMIYLAGVVLTIIPFAVMITRYVGSDPDTFERLMSAFLALMLALAWPAMLVLTAIALIVRRISS